MKYLFQENSYLKELESTVESCDEQSNRTYQLILKETILFPEGGGQPDDHGKINDTTVNKSIKIDGKVAHIVDKPFIPGEKVKITLDWNRRFDHMQQHSGQHLLSAVCSTQFGYETTAWTLGPKTSQIELDVKSLSSEQLNTIERNVNSWIQKASPLNFHFFAPDSPEINQVKSRLEIPRNGADDTIRVVEIKGLDINPCCGTHVQHLGHLQALKLLYSEKGKKNKTILYFVVGNRLLQYLDNCSTRERTLNTILKCGPEEHIDIAQKLQKNLKIAQKNTQGLLRDLAHLEVNQYNNLPEKPNVFVHHRKEADPEYLSILAREMKNEDSFLLLAVGEKAGHMVLCGPTEKIIELGPKVSEILNGKGSIQHGRFQAKVGDLSKLKKAEDLIKIELTSIKN